MTAQFGEKLRYKDKEVEMFTTPLDDYFATRGIDPGFKFTCTALWRGYIGQWEVVDDHLYLVGIEATLADGSAASLATIFPDSPDRVFAHWYSGTIRVPQGEMLDYVHMGYRSTFERNLLIEVEQGIVVATQVHDNEAALLAAAMVENDFDLLAELQDDDPITSPTTAAQTSPPNPAEDDIPF